MGYYSKIRRRILLVAIVAFFLLHFSYFILPAHAAAPPQVSAASAILIDAATGKVLFEKDAHTSRPMASTTKIMTALLVVEHCKPGEMVTVSEEATKVRPSRMDLKKGECISVEDLLTALMVKSANDAAVALAEHVSGSADKFAALMNSRAKELGAKETNFRNPHGLYDPQHYSSAYDLALIARYAMKNPKIRELVATKNCCLRRPDGTELEIANHNKLLFQYPLADGIKTGFVNESGHCLVASANQGGWRLIAVLLNSDGVWEDAQALLDYGFANWEASIFADMEKPLITVGVLGGRNKAPLVPVDTLIDLRARGEHGQVEKAITLDRLVAPIKLGQRVGRVRLLRGEREIGATWLVAGAKVERAAWFTILLIIGRVLLILAIALGGLKGYGKIAKAARRRRHRLQAQSRTVDSGRTSKRGWPDYQAPGREGGPGQE